MYAKLFSRITESSLMEEPINVRYTFVLLLAIADPEGCVVGTDVAIARRLNMNLDEFRGCIEVLRQPDPDSNSKSHDGRRVIESDGERGYQLVNYTTYRDMKDEEDRRTYMREYMRKYREGKQSVNGGKQKLAQLGQEDSSASSSLSGSGSALGEVQKGGRKDRMTREECAAFAVELGLPASDGESLFDGWESNGWKRGSNPIKDAKAAMRNWKSNGWMPSQKQRPSNGSAGLDKSKTCRLRPGEGIPVWDPVTKTTTYMEPHQ